MSSAKNLYLCVELLNKYVYYYYYESSFMTAEDVNHLVDFIKEHIEGLEDKDAAKEGLWFSDDDCDSSTVAFWVKECVSAATGANGNNSSAATGAKICARLVQSLARSRGVG